MGLFNSLFGTTDQRQQDYDYFNQLAALQNSANRWSQNTAASYNIVWAEPSRETKIDYSINQIKGAIASLQSFGIDYETLTTPEDHTAAKLRGDKLITISNGVSLAIRDPKGDNK